VPRRCCHPPMACFSLPKQGWPSTRFARNVQHDCRRARIDNIPEPPPARQCAQGRGLDRVSIVSTRRWRIFLGDRREYTAQNWARAKPCRPGLPFIAKNPFVFTEDTDHTLVGFASVVRFLRKTAIVDPQLGKAANCGAYRGTVSPNHARRLGLSAVGSGLCAPWLGHGGANSAMAVLTEITPPKPAFTNIDAWSRFPRPAVGPHGA